MMRTNNRMGSNVGMVSAVGTGSTVTGMGSGVGTDSTVRAGSAVTGMGSGVAGMGSVMRMGSIVAGMGSVVGGGSTVGAGSEPAPTGMTRRINGFHTAGEWAATRAYIADNPRRWAEDRDNPEAPG